MAKGILIILQNGAIEDDLRVRREVIALRDSGYRISLICPAAAGDKECVDIEGVRIFRYPSPTLGNDFKSYIKE